MKNTYEGFLSTRYDLLATGRDGEFRTVCPFCGNPDRKFYFRFQYSSYSCYHCKSNGSLRNFVYLQHRGEVSYKDLDNGYYMKIDKVFDKAPVQLPEDFISLNNVKSYTGVQYMNYLYKRGLSLENIQAYKFGYSPSLSFQLVIPIYNEIGEQVYYTTRAIRDINNEKVYNPTNSPIYYGKSDVLFNIHRNVGKDTVYIFEGVFSAMSGIICKFNSIALLGKVMSENQLELLQKCNIKTLVVCLDDDADNEAAELCLKLKPYFEVKRVCFPKDLDANDLLLTNELTELLKHPKPFSPVQNLKNLLKKFKKF